MQVPTNLYIAEKAESGGEDEEGERSEVALDLVFVVDCTGSMGGVIRTVQDNIRNIVQKIILSEKVHLRLSLLCVSLSLMFRIGRCEIWVGHVQGLPAEEFER